MKAQLESAEKIVFDVWDVLLCAGLDMAQIRAFSECEALYPGISEYGDSNLTRDTSSGNFSVLCSVLRDIMQKIYRKFYAKHESAYLIFSRFASFELIFGDYPEEYIDKNIKPRIGRRNCDNSVAAVLRECGLNFLETGLSMEGISGTDTLNENSYDHFKQFLLRHKADIETHFQTSCIAAENYFREVCRGHRNVCVVDLGWHGKSVIYLKHFMERKCGMNVNVTGAMVGAFGETVVQDYIRKDMISTYAFENDKWRSQGSRNGEQMDYRERENAVNGFE